MTAPLAALRPLARILAAAALVFLTLAQSASASNGQIALIQDDASFVDGAHGDPFERLAEARALGARIVRVNFSWSEVSPAPLSKLRPAGFIVSDPSSARYDWSPYDRFVANARRLGFWIYITITGPIPHWASRQPSQCGRDRCVWRPDERLFGEFVKAVAQRYRGQVRYWSIWNEPNLRGSLSPQYEYGRVRAAARIYRRLWYYGHRAIGERDPARAGSVLFGETAPFGPTRSFLLMALCLDPRGRPLVSAPQGCARRPRKLRIGAFAHHPYGAGGIVGPRARTRSGGNIPIGYLYRLEQTMDLAARYGRMPGGRPVFITEYGVQTNPPDPFGASLRQQEVWLNEAERLLFGDRRVRTTAQYELVDASDQNVFNTGLRLSDGRAKPSWAAWRLSIVATVRSRRDVEVWGWVKPAAGRVRVEVLARRRGGHTYSRIASPTTTPRGFFRIRHRSRIATRLVYKLAYRAPEGATWYSRDALAGRPLRYQR